MKAGKLGRARATVATVTLIAILVVAGCGSSSSSSQLSHKEVIKQGDAICRKIGVKVRKAMVERTAELRQSGPAGTKAQQKLVAEVAAPSVAKMGQEISKLAAQAEDSEQVEKVASEFEAAATKVEEEPLRAWRENLFGDASNQAASYGFQYCSQI
jgi:hypothetical protein